MEGKGILGKIDKLMGRFDDFLGMVWDGWKELLGSVWIDLNKGLKDMENDLKGLWKWMKRERD